MFRQCSVLSAEHSYILTFPWSFLIYIQLPLFLHQNTNKQKWQCPFMNRLPLLYIKQPANIFLSWIFQDSSQPVLIHLVPHPYQAARSVLGIGHQGHNRVQSSIKVLQCPLHRAPILYKLLFPFASQYPKMWPRHNPLHIILSSGLIPCNSSTTKSQS